MLRHLALAALLASSLAGCSSGDDAASSTPLSPSDDAATDAAPDSLDAKADLAAEADALEASSFDAPEADAPPDVTEAAADVEAGADALQDAGSPCNGSPALCDRPYNQVSVVCTHNAMSNEEALGFDVPTPNQKYGFARQLDDGVRCMMLDTYSVAGQPMLCHGYCALGATPWVPMLQQVKSWLDAHPTEVLTFILEAYISQQETYDALVSGGVYPLVYKHGKPPGSPWPTLKEMIDSNQRLVVFTDASDADAAWHLNWTHYGWETPYDDPTFTCADGRGDPTKSDNQIFILNHYTLCPAGGCASNGELNNLYSSLYPRAVQCWQQHPQYNPWGRIPTFVTVDHYEVPAPGEQSDRADVFDAVDALNAAWGN